jgi:folate-binding protein YgfZ
VYGTFLVALSMKPAAHPSTGTEPGLQLSALLHSFGVSRLDGTGWIRVTGGDRARWLNGMTTNAIQQLASGEGCYSFFLNAQGRIQGDGYIFAQPNALLIETASTQLPTLIPYLDHYIIMDDVELTDISSDWSGIEVIGPESPSVLAQLGLAAAELKPLELRQVTWNNVTVTLVHAHSPLVPRYELWTDGATIDTLLQSLQSTGAVPATPESLEHLRILEATPRFGIDIRDRELPQETAQTRALHFAKGCYLGQEIVERIRSRGNVHRTFQTFRVEGTLPAPGTILEASGKPAGELTSIATIQLDGAPLHLALGYARREALDRGESLTYPGGIAVPVSGPLESEEANTSAKASDNSERK